MSRPCGHASRHFYQVGSVTPSPLSSYSTKRTSRRHGVHTSDGRLVVTIENRKRLFMCPCTKWFEFFLVTTSVKQWFLKILAGRNAWSGDPDKSNYQTDGEGSSDGLATSHPSDRSGSQSAAVLTDIDPFRDSGRAIEQGSIVACHELNTGSHETQHESSAKCELDNK